jgi:ATP-dependent DNA helicase RecQ
VSTDVLGAVQRHWGYTDFRPLQREAMDAAVARRDALVVLPTGGGKSLCYQAPALLAEGVTVVVSPLISLMKDQVDRLLSKNIAAAFLNSSLDSEDRRRVRDDLFAGRLKLLFVAPERFAMEGFVAALKKAKVAAFAIDEAHCISHWGHDFRADYRNLGMLRKTFPAVPIGAFTATATPRVRKDIVAQLGLKDPAVLIGDFFRPNLFYRAATRGSGFGDVMEIVRKRPGQPGIVYCIRRTDVDQLAGRLKSEDVKADPYHAGMSDDERTRVQDRFAAGETDVVVATVAFGMGIDRADIRYVVHAAMPKSLEHYQQETGRAGRDGAPADCILFHSGGDYGLWRQIIESGEGGDKDAKMKMLSEMYAFSRDHRCRHKRLVEYFGQTWTGGACKACDVCTGERPAMEDGADIARRIIKTVAQTGQRFGGAYVTDVACGEATDRVRQNGHHQTVVFGTLREHPKAAVRAWISQLVDQGMLELYGEYNVVRLTPTSANDATLFEVQLSKSEKKRAPKKAEAALQVELKGTAVVTADEEALFEKLKGLRRSIADDMNVPAFVVFSDRTLREMARRRPMTEAQMRMVPGVGPVKWNSFGDRFLEVVRKAT